MTSKIVKLGTRGSDLAMWQTRHVTGLLQQAHPALKTEVVIISTKGDQILDTPLPLIGGKGLFTAELENALLNGEIDFAVHSLKDLPVEESKGLTIGAILERADPADVLISRNHDIFATLPEGATVGTSSNRRKAQLLHLRPDLQIVDIRGNIDTRIRKALDPVGQYEAILLAKAGLTRLNMESVITETLTFDTMLPAPGQGALAIQCRDDGDSLALLTPLKHIQTTLAVSAERAFLRGFGSGCSVPIAAYARAIERQFELIGRVLTVDGSEKIEVHTRFHAENVNQAKQAGVALARIAIKQGANRILESTP